jgi:predicted DNA-binding protein with PD1-like motif
LAVGEENIMKIITEEMNTTLIRFDKDEDIIQGLVAFAKEQNLSGATFSIIGAAKKVILSYYNLDEKTYEDHTLQQDVEITGIVGNIAWMDNEVIIHAHGTFADKNLLIKGGHIKSLIVSATGEVVLQILQTKLVRAFDEETGLNLLK